MLIMPPPSAPKAFAMPAPIPFEAPVTIATLLPSRFMASPRLLSAMQNYQFDQESIRRSVRIASIPMGNRSVVRFGEQLGQKVNKHGDFAGLTAGRGSHGADRNSGRLTIAQDSPHGSAAYVGRKKPVGRLGDTEAGKDRGALLFAVIAAKRGRRLIGYDPSAASEGPGSRSTLRDENHAVVAVEIAGARGLSSAFQIL